MAKPDFLIELERRLEGRDSYAFNNIGEEGFIYPVKGYKTFYSKYALNPYRLYYFKPGHLLDEMTYELGDPEGFVCEENIYRMKNLILDINEADQHPETNRKLRALMKELDDVLERTEAWEKEHPLETIEDEELSEEE